MPEPVPTVLLAGGGSGIGLTILGRLLAELDANVLVLTLCPTVELTALASEYGDSRLILVYGDVCNDDAVAKAVDATIANFSYMTHLINCVGTMLPVEKISEVSMNAFRRIFDINVFAAVSLVQKCLPHLKQSPMRPKIIVVSSGVDNEVQYQGWSGYCTSKAALTRFIQLLAHEERDVDVFGALPLVTKSPMVDMIFAGKYDKVMLPEERERFNVWAKEDKIEPPEYIADSIMKAAKGEINRESPEVKRFICGALFVGSLYEQQRRPNNV